MKVVLKKMTEINTLDEASNIDKRTIISGAKKFIEFNHFLFNFFARYGHIFEYDFNNKDYNNLINNSTTNNTFCFELLYLQ